MKPTRTYSGQTAQVFRSSLLATLFTTASLFADNYTWTGGGSNTNWSTPANWSPAGPPGPVSSGTGTNGLIFSGPTAQRSYNDLSFGYYTNLTFSNGGFVIAGQNLGLQLGNLTSVSGTNTIPGLIRGGAPGNRIIDTQAGQLTIGTLNMQGQNAQINGAGITVINGLSGGGGLLRIFSLGQTVLGGNSSAWPGTIHIYRFAKLTNAKGLGGYATPVTLDRSYANAYVDLNGQEVAGVNVTFTTAEAGGVGGTRLARLRNTSSVAASFAGDISTTLSNNVGVDGSGNLLLSGTISGTNGLIKLDSSTLTLSGFNTYTGPTVVSNGTLIVNGWTDAGSAVTVASGAKLGGVGTIGGNVTFAPGAMPLFTDGGTLTISGSLTANGNVVHLNLSDNVQPNTYLLANYNDSGSSVSLAASPAVDSGWFAPNTTNYITIAGGQISLVVEPLVTPPTSITYSVSGNQLALNWPGGLGWRLQSQTNTLQVGISTNWAFMPGANPPYTVVPNPANPSVFYRLAQGGTPSETNFVIYGDALASGWADNGWSYTVNLANPSPVHSGTASMAYTLESGGGAGPFKSSGVDTTPYKTLSFWLHGGSTGGQKLTLQIVRGISVAGTLSLPTLPANTWVNFALPLGVLGLTDVPDFSGIRFVDAASSGAVPVFYADDVMLTSVPAPLPIYRDTLFPGFLINGWSGSVNLTNSSPVQSGTASMAITLQAGGGQGPMNFSGVDTTPYKSLSFWIHGGASGGQNLSIQVVRGAGVVANFALPTLPANTWVNYALPLSALGVANVTDFNGIRFTASAAAVFYVDELLLSEVEAPLPIFRDSLFPGFLINGWSGSVNTTNPTPVHSGTASMAFTLLAGGGQGPLNFTGVDTAPYGVLSFWINGGVTGGQSLTMQVVRGTAVTATWPVPALPANTWTNYILPLNTLGVDNVTDFNGIRFVASGSSAPPVFYVDDLELAK